MKKILFIIACFLTSIAHADNLSIAIRNNDLQKVTELLQQRTMTSADYAVYIAASNESIHLAREQLLLQQLKPKMHGCWPPLLCLISVLGLIGGSVSLVNNDMYRGSCLYIGSFITLLIAAGTGVAKRDKYLQQQYNNALQIQELILNRYNAPARPHQARRSRLPGA